MIPYPLDDVTEYTKALPGQAALIEMPVALPKRKQQGWRKYAVCHNKYGDAEKYPNHLWCRTQGKAGHQEKEICWTECSVRRECITTYIGLMDKFCIAGGYGYDERKIIHRRWKKDGILPDVDRWTPDSDEILDIIYGGATSNAGFHDEPGLNSRLDPYDADEPTAEHLAAIEAEESV